jgi:hypothetical protein
MIVQHTVLTSPIVALRNMVTESVRICMHSQHFTNRSILELSIISVAACWSFLQITQEPSSRCSHMIFYPNSTSLHGWDGQCVVDEGKVFAEREARLVEGTPARTLQNNSGYIT